jgi:hypothetical protein
MASGMDLRGGSPNLRGKPRCDADPLSGKVGSVAPSEHPPQGSITMASRAVTRLASAAVVTGIATLALPGPAGAVYPKEPDLGARVEVKTPPPPVSDSFDYTALAGGALGGIALAGVGVAAAAGLRRHQHHLAHPV